MTLPILPVTREQIMSTLLAHFQADLGTTFRTYSRRFLTWEDVVNSYQSGVPLQQPALFLYDGVGFGGGIERWDPRGFGNPSVITLQRTVVIYAQLPGGGTPYGVDVTVPGGSVLHPLIEAVYQSIAPDDPSFGTNTLGGIVSHCWIKGEGMIVTGELDATAGQGMATLPIEIVMYPSL
jgi:hypothetical protein